MPLEDCLVLSAQLMQSQEVVAAVCAFMQQVPASTARRQHFRLALGPQLCCRCWMGSSTQCWAAMAWRPAFP